jgi:hypothetical protein
LVPSIFHALAADGMEAPIEDFVAWLETLIEADILMREVSENA